MSSKYLYLAVTVTALISQASACSGHERRAVSGMPTAYTAPAAIPVSMIFNQNQCTQRSLKEAMLQTGLFSSYYPGFEPTQTTAQPMPVISDPVSHVIYPLNLTSPYTVPGVSLSSTSHRLVMELIVYSTCEQNNTVDPIQYPPQQIQNANWTGAWGVSAISAIIANNTTKYTNCVSCVYPTQTYLAGEITI